MAYCVNSFRTAALAVDPRYEHIEAAEKTKVRIYVFSCPASALRARLRINLFLQVIEECNRAEAWLAEKQQLQSQLPKTANPVLFSAEIKKAAENLDK